MSSHQLPLPLAALAREVTDRARVQIRLLLASLGSHSGGRLRDVVAHIGQPPEAGGAEGLSFWVAVIILSLHPSVGEATRSLPGT